jgi:hypothetical protein
VAIWPNAIGALEGRVEVLKAEAIRREIHRAEGENYRIVLTPPGTQQRTDKLLLLRVLGITAAEYTTRFCHPLRAKRLALWPRTSGRFPSA